MIFAVFQFWDIDRDFPSGFPSPFLHFIQLFSQGFVLHHLLADLLGILGILQKEIDDCVFHFIDDPGADLRIGKLVLRLRLENRTLDLYRDRSDNPFADILGRPVLLEVLADPLPDSFLECRKVGPPSLVC